MSRYLHVALSSPTLAEPPLDLELARSPASFRDPAGFVFFESGLYKRAVTDWGQADYDLLMASGLYQRLSGSGRLVAHREEPAAGRNVYKILVPEQIRHISYGYEWSFAQWKDAALLTLAIQKEALACGMTLKDASVFNVQFQGPRAVFIDTLSFEKNEPGPWVAYGQFCAHFLAPLALMANVAPDFGRRLRVHLDGFPLDLASKLLPARTWWKLGLLLHLHLHARSQRKHADTSAAEAPRRKAAGADRKAVLVDSLRSAVEALELPRARTEWIRYYDEARHYSDQARHFKHSVVERVADELEPGLVYDLGGNIGTFGRIFTARGIDCVCYDIDPLCVNENHLRSQREGDLHMLALQMDLTNPSPALGFGLRERARVDARSKPDLVLALALLHHLRLTGNIPLAQMAEFLARMGKALLIEFVPKEDPMAQRLVRNRADIFHDYSWEGFERAFARDFEMEWAVDVPGTQRRLCLLRVR